MPSIKEAEDLRQRLERKLSSESFFSGIEIAAYFDGVDYTDEPCVKILVNREGMTLEDLHLPTEMDGIKLVIEERTIFPL